MAARAPSPLKKTYSTLEISRMCHVDPVTVARWCDQGEIKCFRTPGGHRRILHEDLLVFFRKQRIPLPPELGKGGTRILIVDDDPDFVKVLRIQLKDARPDCDVDVASTGVEALLKIGTDLPDVVLLDLLLPKMDGVEVCRRVKENPKTSRVLVIAVTASGDRRRAEAVLRAGAAACLAKPVRVADLAVHLVAV